MKELYANIMARCVSDLLKRTRDNFPVTSKVLNKTTGWPTFELGTKVEFSGTISNGNLAGKAPASGYVALGLVGVGDVATPTLVAMARSFNCCESVIDTPTGPENILSEFLNIIIGLTASEWAEHGFDLTFSSPLNYSGVGPSEKLEEDHSFRIMMSGGNGMSFDFLVVFNSLKPPLEGEIFKDDIQI